MYRLTFTSDAQKELKRLQHKYPKVIKKLTELLEEIKNHPKTGTGQLELLKHYKEETWSRRINQEHRIVYRVYEETKEALIISVYGHYRGK